MIGKWHGCVTSNPIKMTCIFHGNSIEFDRNIIGTPWGLPSISTKLPSKWHGKNPYHIFSRGDTLPSRVHTSRVCTVIVFNNCWLGVKSNSHEKQKNVQTHKKKYFCSLVHETTFFSIKLMICMRGPWGTELNPNLETQTNSTVCTLSGLSVGL